MEFYIMNKEIKKFYVSSSAEWNTDAFNTLEEASNTARQRAWQGGRDQGIYQLLAIAEQPKEVNTIKLTTVS